jgi:TPR repeat protein
VAALLRADDSVAGFVVPPDVRQAARLYLAAAALGNATAHFTAAVLHAHGLWGAPQSEGRAVVHLYFGALGGSRAAQLALGMRHSMGRSVPQSCAAAVLYLQESAAAAAAAVTASHGLLQAAPPQPPERLGDEELEALWGSAATRGGYWLAKAGLRGLWEWTRGQLRVGGGGSGGSDFLSSSGGYGGEVSNAWVLAAVANATEAAALRYSSPDERAAQLAGVLRRLSADNATLNDLGLTSVEPAAESGGTGGRNADAAVGAAGSAGDTSVAAPRGRLSTQPGAAAAAAPGEGSELPGSHALETSAGAAAAAAASQAPSSASATAHRPQHTPGPHAASTLTPAPHRGSGSGSRPHLRPRYTPPEPQILGFYHNAADKGELHAHVALGHLYLLGVRHVPQDFAKAGEHFHAAAEASEPLSMANLGFMYLHGLGVQRDYALAREFLSDPATQGLASAANTLGFMHLRGLGGPPDAPAAHALFSKAAAAGYSESMYNLGLMALEGSAPGGRDFKAAHTHLQGAAAAGHVGAMYRAGLMHLHGIGECKKRSGPEAGQAWGPGAGRAGAGRGTAKAREGPSGKQKVEADRQSGQRNSGRQRRRLRHAQCGMASGHSACGTRLTRWKRAAFCERGCRVCFPPLLFSHFPPEPCTLAHVPLSHLESPHFLAPPFLPRCAPAAGMAAPDCPAAQRAFRGAIARVLPALHPDMDRGGALLADGHADAAALAFLRASELGLEAGTWNAAFLLSKGLVSAGAVTPAAPVAAVPPAAAAAAAAAGHGGGIGGDEHAAAATAQLAGGSSGAEFAAAAAEGVGSLIALLALQRSDGAAAVAAAPGAGLPAAVEPTSTGLVWLPALASAAVRSQQQLTTGLDAAAEAPHHGSADGAPLTPSVAPLASAAPSAAQHLPAWLRYYTALLRATVLRGGAASLLPVGVREWLHAHSAGSSAADGAAASSGTDASPAADDGTAASSTSSTSSSSSSSSSVTAAAAAAAAAGLPHPHPPPSLAGTDLATQRRALALLQAAAGHGNAHAELLLGDYFFYGGGGLNVSAGVRACGFRGAAASAGWGSACCVLVWACGLGRCHTHFQRFGAAA